jgi:arabinogalactan oligomer / maltooligosaccharide transport system permease protein
MRRDSSKMKKKSSGGVEYTSAKVKRLILNIITHIFLTILGLIWVSPVAWVIITSFRAEKGPSIKRLIPKNFTIDNYTKLFKETTILNFPKMFMNTFIIAIIVCLISTFFVLSVAYCMSRLRFRIRKPLMNICMILGLFPGFMSMIAVYYILKSLGLTTGGLIRVALVMVYSGGSGMGFYIAKGFFDTIPKTLDEAACIDGATKFQVFSKIIIPLSKPIIVYTVLTSFMGPWLDFIFAKVICLTNKDYYTVAIGLWNMLEKGYVIQWFNSFCAGAVLISIPIAIIFISMQKFYQDGMSGAVKG